MITPLLGAKSWQLHRLFIHVDQRVPWIIGTLIDIQDIFHVGHKVGIILRGNHPTLVGDVSQVLMRYFL
jgi:hypothetical protein